MRIWFWIFAWIALAASQTPAFAEKRVALVIGNSAYQNVAPLTNPSNDAAAIAATLTKAGFDIVDAKSNLSGIEMRRVLRDFGSKVRDADVAVVYYAGHGIELDGTNYLIPVDAKLEMDTDVLDETFPLDRFIVAVDPAKQLRLVILDACRDNPFAKTMKRTIGARAITRGLAKVEPTNPNTLIAFAAKAGSTASDGEGGNSPFASALVKHMTKPGLDLRKAFGFVRDDVLKVTNNKQEPFVYGSLGGNDVALVPAVAAPAPAAAAPQADANAPARRDYELAAQVGTREAWDYFIATYPDSFYAKLAQAQRNKLAAEEARIAATEKAKAAQDEQTRLAAEGAKKAEQEKAAAESRKAEQQRVAAEKATAEKEARLEAERAKAAAQAKSAEDAKAVAKETPKPEAKIAALTPDQPPQKPDAPVMVADIPKQLQAELRRVGCNTGAVGDTWTPNAQKAMEAFNKNAGMKLDVKVASADSLDAVKSKPGRICPLICDHGYRAEGERCEKIVCRAGFEVGDDNTCEKIEVRKPAPPAAKRETPSAPKTAETAPATGQFVCNQLGCRPVKKGCHVRTATHGGTARQDMEICN